MTNRPVRRSFLGQALTNSRPGCNNPSIETVQVDMMTGRIDQYPDQMTSSGDSWGLTKVAQMLALAAMATCLQGGPGVVAPRPGESSAVFAAPDVMPRNKR